MAAVHHGDLHNKTVIRAATMAATHGDRREANSNHLYSHQTTTTPTSKVVHSNKVQTTTRRLVVAIATTPAAAAATTATGETLSRHPADLVKLPAAMHSGRLSEMVRAVQEAISSRIGRAAVDINVMSRPTISNAAEVDNLQTVMAEVIHDKPSWTFRNNFELFFYLPFIFFPLTL